MSSNLSYNILTFSVPPILKTFYFSKDPSQNTHRIHKNLFPVEVGAQFPDLLTHDEAYLYTTFTDYSTGLDEIKFDLSTSPFSFVKRYYNYLVYHYFKKQGFLIRNNFVKDNEIWIKCSETQTLTVYDKYTLRVQQATITDRLELLVIYGGQSKVLKKSVSQLGMVAPEHYGLVIHKNEIMNYQRVKPEDEIDFALAFPSLNWDIIDDMGWTADEPSKENKYVNFKNKITFFHKTHLANEAFKSLVPISLSFLKVKEAYINHVEENSNLLVFGNNVTHTDAWQGIKANGPYRRTEHIKVHFFFIFHEDDFTAVEAFDGYLKKGVSYFNGLEKVAKINYYTAPNFSVKFKDKENPIAEIQAQLAERELDKDIQYFAFYLSPYSKYDKNKKLRAIYYDIKKLLLTQKIHSQAIDIEKMISQGTSYWYSMRNIAVAVLAKLNAIPWQIETELKKELVVGVGAFRNDDSGVQYIGSAFSFQNTGKFQEFECFVKTTPNVLAGSIHEAIKRYVANSDEPKRLIIHFYKTMSKEEIKPILDKLHHLGLVIPVYIISINKTQSTDIIAWDNEWPALMPFSGTFIKAGRNRYLLFNNTRYANEVHKSSDGYPFPVKLHISCTKPDKLDETVTKELVDQIYQFSRMYWKSVKQQHLPVTIRYPEMLAEIFPHFDSYHLPEFGKDKLWFL